MTTNDLTTLTDADLNAAIVSANHALSGNLGDARKLTVELARRNDEKAKRIAELEGGTTEPEAPIEPDGPGDHNAIMEAVYAAVPTEQGLLQKFEDEGGLTKRAMFGTPKFKDDWMVRDDDRMSFQHFDGSGGGTNAHIRVPGKAWNYDYNDDIIFGHCLIENACRWGMRLYGVRRGLAVYDSLIRNIRKEHGIYANLCGGYPNTVTVNIEDTLFVNIDSQALQFVQRDQFWPDQDALGETPNPDEDFTPGGAIYVTRVGVLDGAGPTGDRESFDFSFFRSRNRVQLFETLIDDRDQELSRGFLMAQGYHGLADNYERRITSDRFVWRSATSKQQCVSFQDMSVVRMRDGVIDVPHGSNAKITLDGCSDDFVFSNITSLNAPVRVVIDGVDAGTVDQLSGVA